MTTTDYARRLAEAVVALSDHHELLDAARQVLRHLDDGTIPAFTDDHVFDAHLHAAAVRQALRDEHLEVAQVEVNEDASIMMLLDPHSLPIYGDDVDYCTVWLCRGSDGWRLYWVEDGDEPDRALAFRTLDMVVDAPPALVASTAAAQLLGAQPVVI